MKLKKAREEESQKQATEKEFPESTLDVVTEIVYPVRVMCEVWKCHCGETYNNQKEFVKHNRDTHNTAMKLCEYCGEFVRWKGIRSHILKHLPEEQRKDYLCNVCGKSYLWQKYLKKHMAIVHDGKRVKCDKCNKEFRGDQTLKKHLLTHMNMLNFVCSYCGKRFVSKDSMQTHTRVHTGERPYECEYCGEKFNHNVSRKNHIRKAHPGKEIHKAVKGFSH